MMRKYVTLDGLRGIAALSIVVLHCHRFTGDIGKPAAALAVDLFFVLSGFVLAFAYEAKLPAGSGAFLKARLIRLYPLYLVGTALGVIEALVGMRFGGGSQTWTWPQFWTSLPFAVTMIPAPGKTMYPFDGVMWSIFFELFINVVWAVFWKPLQSTRVLLAVIAASAVGLAFNVWVWHSETALGMSWASFAGGAFRVSYSFFLGVVLFRFHKQWKLPKLPPIVLFAGLPAVLFLPLSPFAQLAVALCVLPWFVVLGAQVEPRGSLAYASRQLGIASYAVYAVHKRLYLLTYGFVLKALHVDLARFAPWPVVVFIAVLVPACLLLNKLVDEPARRWLTARTSLRVRVAASREEATQAP
jgi:peptidoglycan/LPS O-acetylase OafA/YrhL